MRQLTKVKKKESVRCHTELSSDYSYCNFHRHNCRGQEEILQNKVPISFSHMLLLIIQKVHLILLKRTLKPHMASIMPSYHSNLSPTLAIKAETKPTAIK